MGDLSTKVLQKSLLPTLLAPVDNGCLPITAQTFLPVRLLFVHNFTSLQQQVFICPVIKLFLEKKCLGMVFDRAGQAVFQIEHTFPQTSTSKQHLVLLLTLPIAIHYL